MTPILIEDQGISDRKRLRLKMQYYFLYEKNGLLMITYVIFVVSFLIRYEQAQIVHLVIVLRLLEMNRFLDVLFFKIYTYKFLKVMYTLTIIFYVLLYLSHILGCIFYIIDEKLIDLQYFGDPREYPSRIHAFIQITISFIQDHSCLSTCYLNSTNIYMPTISLLVWFQQLPTGTWLVKIGLKTPIHWFYWGLVL